MCALKVDKSSAEFHQRSYRLFSPFMDRSQYGSMMLVLRQKPIADVAARRRAGLDIVDIFSVGTDAADPQILHTHSLHRGDRTVVLEHTYMYWAQIVTLNDLLEDEYGVVVPHLNRSKKENGLLACVELDGCHMAPLTDRYVIWTFRLKARGQHKCKEETASAPTETVVALGDYGGIACPYCLAEQLNINL